MYPKTIEDLITCFKKFPGIGSKTAERLALATLKMDNDTIKLFSESLINVKTKIKKCQKCGNISEEDLCPICKDETRDKTTICVVEDSKNITLFEKLGTYHGLYHVLNGLISPIDGINPSDINIDSLIKRVQEENTKEVILAVPSSVEGETTSLYIKKLLEKYDVTVTKIAHGVPMGAEMDYIDPLTLEIALNSRSKIS